MHSTSIRTYPLVTRSSHRRDEGPSVPHIASVSIVYSPNPVLSTRYLGIKRSMGTPYKWRHNLYLASHSFHPLIPALIISAPESATLSHQLHQPLTSPCHYNKAIVSQKLRCTSRSRRVGRREVSPMPSTTSCRALGLRCLFFTCTRAHTRLERSRVVSRYDDVGRIS